jgi:hypothetical protein
MSKHYYIADSTQPRGFVEVSGEEFTAVIGDDTTRPYAGKVYSGVMSIDEVPEDLREAVAAVVAARTERFGAWEERELSAQEALDIIVGGSEA